MKHTTFCGLIFWPDCHTKKLWTLAKTREGTNEIENDYD